METLLLFILFIYLVILLLFAFYLVISFIFITPFYPSRIKDLENEWEDLDIKFTGSTKFIDLGSGDGRVVRWAARKGMNATGIEINPFLTLVSRLLNFIMRIKNIKIINGNFYKLNFSEYDIVFLYIYKEHMNKLYEKLKQELKPGSVIVSNVFVFDSVEPNYKGRRLRKYVITENK